MVSACRSGYCFDVATEFLIHDEGDGWWHCPTPLRAVVIDGPASDGEPPEEAWFPETFWLVRVEPKIEWHGDTRYAERWGADHPLCHPIAPTSVALVMASSRWSGPIDPARAGGVPVYPVLNDASSVSDAEPVGALGMKVGLSAP